MRPHILILHSRDLETALALESIAIDDAFKARERLDRYEHAITSSTLGQLCEAMNAVERRQRYTTSAQHRLWEVAGQLCDSVAAVEAQQGDTQALYQRIAALERKVETTQAVLWRLSAEVASNG